ncbi:MULTISPECIES: hypothetical protein [Cysteiniphilum]|uniref:hypothetical protein n=1 Tax=Cysteiniphilum TaxID=2056696 RepID=UPI001784F2E0|nr:MULTISPECIES: hypothetical protein [Cysteiniphilum]
MSNYEDHVSRIDSKIKSLCNDNATKVTILDEMYNDMAIVKDIIDNHSQIALDNFCDRYTGFYHFMTILEKVSQQTATA